MVAIKLLQAVHVFALFASASLPHTTTGNCDNSYCTGRTQKQRRDSGQIDLLANTTSGTVQGFADSTADQVTIVKFYGIPYAKAPMGPLRFKPPVNPDPWTGVRQATKFGHECLQKDRPLYTLKNGEPPGRSEDCLFLNVYKPVFTDPTAQAALAVMVWIHGGSYMFGAGSQYDVTNLATKGVVVVTINYRLDALGFLSTQDDVIPGNYGSLDQIFALKWVQANIGKFGGDPNQVTIFGQSAGSASVSLLTLSPLANGLFQNAILESGNSLNPWAFQHPAAKVSARLSSRLVASAVGCTEIDDSNKLLACLQNVNGDLLVNKSYDTFMVLDSGQTLLSPRVETTYGFLPDLPIRLLDKIKNLQVNTLRGYNKNEYGSFVFMLLSAKDNVGVEDFRDACREALEPFAIVDIYELIQMMESNYLKTTNDSQSIKTAILDVYDDIMFTGGILTEIGIISNRSAASNHFLYEFDHKSSGFNPFPPWISSVHNEELAYVFGGLDLGALTQFGTLTDDERTLSALVMDLWTNFAKTGVPTSSLLSANWPPFHVDSKNYLKLGTTPQVLAMSRPEVENLYMKFLQKIDTRGVPSSVVG